MLSLRLGIRSSSGSWKFLANGRVQCVLQCMYCFPDSKMQLNTRRRSGPMYKPTCNDRTETPGSRRGISSSAGARWILGAAHSSYVGFVSLFSVPLLASALAFEVESGAKPAVAGE